MEGREPGFAGCGESKGFRPETDPTEVALSSRKGQEDSLPEGLLGAETGTEPAQASTTLPPFPTSFPLISTGRTQIRLS